MKKLLFLVSIAIIFTACVNNNSSMANKSQANNEADSAARALDSLQQVPFSSGGMKIPEDAEAVANNTWQYSQEVDKMTSKTDYYAELDANDEVYFSPPYDGGSMVRLLIRYRDNENDIMLEVKPAQFNSDVVNGENIRIRFDNEQPITCNCREPSDYSTTMLFLPSSLITELKKAKKIIIQAEFYDNGLKEMEFNTEGLVWNH